MAGGRKCAKYEYKVRDFFQNFWKLFWGAPRPKCNMATVFHWNTQYSVIIVSYVFVRIANSGETLSSNCSVELCYQIDDAKFQDGCQIQNGCRFSWKTHNSVISVSSVLVRIANGGKTLALNSSVVSDYFKDDAKFPRWPPKFNMATVFHEETVFCDNWTFYDS